MLLYCIQTSMKYQLLMSLPLSFIGMDPDALSFCSLLIVDHRILDTLEANLDGAFGSHQHVGFYHMCSGQQIVGYSRMGRGRAERKNV